MPEAPTKRANVAGELVPLRPSDSSACAFDDQLMQKMNRIAASELTPSGALELLTGLLLETPTASKENIDRIKMMDKLLNTARAMMETKIKNEEITAVKVGMDEIEKRINAIFQCRTKSQSLEVWNEPGNRNGTVS